MDQPVTPEVAATRKSSLVIRVASTVVMVPLVMGLLLWPGGNLPFTGWPCALGFGVLALLALREFYAGCRMLEYRCHEGIGYAATILFVGLATPLAPPERREGLMVAGLSALLLVSLVLEVFQKEYRPLRNVSTTWMGALYVGLLATFIVRLRTESELVAANLQWTLPQGWMSAIGHGGWLMLFVLFSTAFVDTGAYFVGKRWGRRKLAPDVSPNKTVEGAIGGLLAAVLAGCIVGWLVRLPWLFVVVASVMIGVLGQLGDLAKSSMKREIGIKDFGDLIPGHGGVLDRGDSMLFAAPAIYWLILIWDGIGI